MQRHALKPSYAAALTETLLRRSSPGVCRLSQGCSKAHPGPTLQPCNERSAGCLWGATRRILGRLCSRQPCNWKSEGYPVMQHGALLRPPTHCNTAQMEICGLPCPVCERHTTGTAYSRGAVRTRGGCGEIADNWQVVNIYCYSCNCSACEIVIHSLNRHVIRAG